MRKHSTAIVGLGNPYRNDDGLGAKAIQNLKTKTCSIAIDDLHVETGDPTHILDLFEQYKNIIIIDAICDEHLKIGETVHATLFNGTGIGQGNYQPNQPQSTHSLNIAQTLELAQNIGLTIPHIELFGIVSLDFDYGEVLSPPVQAQFSMLLESIEKRYNELRSY